jgi:hypothetical protein
VVPLLLTTHALVFLLLLKRDGGMERQPSPGGHS